MRVRRLAARCGSGRVQPALIGVAARGGGGGDRGIVRHAPIADLDVVAIAHSAVPLLETGGTAELSAVVSGGAMTAVRTVTGASSADAISRLSAMRVVTAVDSDQSVFMATSHADRTKIATFSNGGTARSRFARISSPTVGAVGQLSATIDP